MKQKNSWYGFVFLGILVVAGIASLPYHHGPTVFDSAEYIKCADALVKGKLVIRENFFANRIGSYILYVPMMILFGFGKWFTVITTAQFLVLLGMVYGFLQRYDRAIALLTTAFLAISHIMLQNASVLMGDMLETLTVNATIIIYLYYRFNTTNHNTSAKIMGGATGICWIMAILVKESALFYIPLLAYFAWQDYKRGVGRVYWKHVLSTSFVGVVGIMVFYTVETGNPLYRLKAVELQPTLSDCNYTNASFWDVMKRCTIQPFQFLIGDTTFGILLFLSIFFFTKQSRTIQDHYIRSFLIVPLGMWWLGSQSFSSWNPVALSYRLWLPIIVPLAINGAFGIQAIIDQQKLKKMNIVIVFLFLVIVMRMLYFLYQEKAAHGLVEYPTWLRYPLLGLLIICIPFIKGFRIGKIAAFGCIMLGPVVYGHYLSTNVDRYLKNEPDVYDDEQEIVLAAEQMVAPMILSEFALVRNHGIYDHFNESTKFIDYTTEPKDSLKRGVLLIINTERLYYSVRNLNETGIYTSAHNHIPDFVLHPEQYGFRLVKENKTCKLFRLE